MTEITITEYGSLFVGLGFLILVSTISLGIATLFDKRKTKKYREELTDLYVAAKTRFYANEDKLDLATEYENFKLWSKKKKQENPEYALDNAIEDELMDKVGANKLDKLKK